MQLLGYSEWLPGSCYAFLGSSWWLPGHWYVVARVVYLVTRVFICGC